MTMEIIKICELFCSSSAEPNNFDLALELAKSINSDIGAVCLNCVAEITQAVISMFDRRLNINPSINFWEHVDVATKNEIKVRLYKSVGCKLPKSLYKRLFLSLLYYYDTHRTTAPGGGNYAIGSVVFLNENGNVNFSMNGRNVVFYVRPEPVNISVAAHLFAICGVKTTLNYAELSDTLGETATPDVAELRLKIKKEIQEAFNYQTWNAGMDFGTGKDVSVKGTTIIKDGE